MLRDDGFSSHAKVDRYGRKLPSGAGRKDLEKFYRIEDEDADSDEEVQKELERVNQRDAPNTELSLGIEGEDHDTSSLLTSDDSESEDDSEPEEEEVFGLLEQQEESGEGIPRGEVSSRLAVVNLDWDNIRAMDLMAVFSSFVPGNGRILKVSVYPSEFGRERMEKEETEGPPKEIFAREQRTQGGFQEDDVGDGLKSTSDDEDEGLSDEEDDEKIKKAMLQEDEGIDFNSTKLRRYQLERLRYYYAVLTCSSTSIAQTIYDAVDGTEYLTTANFFDLRYIPDETDFSTDRPRDECERIPDGYRPNEFVTDALQHSKVKLTWDADDGARKEAQKRAFTRGKKDFDENDLKAYLGSDNSDDGDEKPDAEEQDAESSSMPAHGNDDTADSSRMLSKKEIERQRVRTLLGLEAEPSSRKPTKDKDRPVGDMQVTFTSGFSADLDKKGSVFENEPERDETTAEKYVRKERERKARRREKAKSKRTDNEDGNGLDEHEDQDSNGLEDEDQPQVTGDENQDEGFDDPFFTDGPEAASASPSQRQKAERKRRHKENRADHIDNAATTPPPTNDDDNQDIDNNDDEDDEDEGTNHFDINALTRAEHRLSKPKSKSKNKNNRLSARDKAALEMKARDTFQMDVDDARFRDVFDRSEYAIDPSHPRYKGTEGMRKLLEEGRERKRKRKRIGFEDDGSGAGEGMRARDVEGGRRGREKIGKGKERGKENGKKGRR